MSNCTFNDIVIIGAGISGLTAAYELARVFGKRVIVVEKESYNGGLSATLKVNHLKVDIGSHRIQSTVSRKIRYFISDTLGVELIKQPRRGLLYLHGMKLRYPPSISNFLSEFPIKQSLSYLLSFIERFRYPNDTPANLRCFIVWARGFMNIFMKTLSLNYGELHQRWSPLKA